MTCGAIHFVRLQAVLAVTTLSDSLVGNSVFPFHLIAPLLIQLCWRFHENGFQGAPPSLVPARRVMAEPGRMTGHLPARQCYTLIPASLQDGCQCRSRSAAHSLHATVRRALSRTRQHWCAGGVWTAQRARRGFLRPAVFQWQRQDDGGGQVHRSCVQFLRVFVQILVNAHAHHGFPNLTGAAIQIGSGAHRLARAGVTPPTADLRAGLPPCPLP